MRKALKTFRPLLAGVLAASCALATAQPVVQREVIDEGGIGRYWTLADGAVPGAPRYPQQFVARGADVCVNIGYMINRDGTTSDFYLLKSWSDGASALSEDELDAFVNSAGLALSKWRFARKADGPVPHPVYTSATLMFFGGKTGADAVAVRSHCAIADLAGFIDERRNDVVTNRDKLASFRWDRTHSEHMPHLK